MLRRTPLFYLGSNWISLTGVVLVTTAGILWLLLLPSWWKDDVSNPYLGILSNMALPALLLSGLLLIPLGIWWRNRQRAAAGEIGPMMPRGGELRKLGIFVALTTFVNLLIGSQLLYSAVAYMDSRQFCGQACHVMQPEYTAYQRSPHANVACTDCHIGSGAPWLLKAKLNGTKQLMAVVFHSYPTPVPTPVTSLRPAKDICGHCHSTQRSSGDPFLVRTHYGDDEKNTAATSIVRMKLGGHGNSTTGVHGFHSEANGKIEYISTDGRRQVIPEVKFTAHNGEVTVYKSTDAKVTAQQLAAGEHRAMDCIDCHNRPAHTFELPGNAVDKAIAAGRIDPALPFIKQQAVAALRAGDVASLTKFYGDKYPQADTVKVKSAIATVQAIYSSNVFPDMKVTWGTYPNNLGHTDTLGCFRCHDGNHTSANGKIISNDCASCHDLLAMEEKDPKALKGALDGASLMSGGGASK